MAVNSVNNYSSAVNAYQKTSNTKSTEETKETTSTTSTPKEDTFEKSATYKPDMDKVNSMKSDLGRNVSAFKQMVQGLFQKQGSIANSAMGKVLEIDQETQLNAQSAIAEGGEWGVEATANRILEFAKALAGGDPSKAEGLLAAVEKGFKAAEKIWGGKLPDISYQTLDRIKEGFEEWKNSSGTAEAV